MLKTQTKIIDDLEIIITQMQGRRALKLQIKLVKLLSPSIGTLISNVKNVAKLKQDIDKEIDGNTISKAIQMLSENLNPDEFFNLILEILHNTRVQNPDNAEERLEVNNQNFDVLFTGKNVFMYKVIIETLKVNFNDFFAMGGIGITAIQ